MRVLCNFENEFSAAYAYLSSSEAIALNSVKDLRFFCAKIGLEPVEIVAKDDLDIIIWYLLDVCGNQLTYKTIPLAYDYTCDSGKRGCEGKFRSLNDGLSPDISKMMLERLD